MMPSPATWQKTWTSALLLAYAGCVLAQPVYPNRPVRVIVPYPTGGSVDPLARLVTEKLGEGLKQRLIVDNRPGGNTIIGSDALAKSKPDGYTLMVMSRTFIVTSLLFPTPFDVVKDFTPIGTLASSEVLLLVHPSLPVNNLKELIALAKARPGQLNYATNFGSTLHIAGEMLKSMAGIQMQIVNYKGCGPAFADLVGGHVELSLQPVISSVPYVKSGRLKAIAVSGERRLPALPAVATFTESGMPGFYSKSWFGMLGPAGMSREIVTALSTEIARTLALPDFSEKLTSLGMDPFVSAPEAFAAMIRSDIVKFGEIIKANKIKVEG
jgi:tripartite-type tricarboxylate transporter receptor subunit TctC